MAATAWTFDFVHSHVGFSVRHMVVSKVHGQFKKWSGQLNVDEQNLANSSVEVHIDTSSIDTQMGQRDDHLRSPDFLNAADFPEIVYKSRKLEKKSDTEYRVLGDLTIRNVTREVPLALEFNGLVKSPWGDERAGFSAKASIDRREFGLTWNKALEAGGVLVGDKVEINIEVEAIKAAATQVA